jgi:hypothetical protein
MNYPAASGGVLNPLRNKNKSANLPPNMDEYPKFYMILFSNIFGYSLIPAKKSKK